MSRRLHPRVEEDLYRHYEPHANWTNWLPHVVLEIPPSWDEFRKRTYIPFLEGLKGIGMIDDPVLYFGATNETALGWFPVEERTDREWEDIADWLCRQDLTSDDSLRCAYILARRAVVGEAKDLFVGRLEKGGVDKWLLLMLRGGAMNLDGYEHGLVGQESVSLPSERLEAFLQPAANHRRQPEVQRT